MFTRAILSLWAILMIWIYQFKQRVQRKYIYKQFFIFDSIFISITIHQIVVKVPPKIYVCIISFSNYFYGFLLIHMRIYTIPAINERFVKLCIAVYMFFFSPE